MRKLILIAILVAIGFGIYNSQKCPFPQFTDEENHIICIEEGIY